MDQIDYSETGWVSDHPFPDVVYNDYYNDYIITTFCVYCRRPIKWTKYQLLEMVRDGFAIEVYDCRVCVGSKRHQGELARRAQNL